MPHLRFETTADVEAGERTAFAEWIAEEFADVMETGRGHVGVSVDVRPRGTLHLGRAEADEDVTLVDADIRAGRSVDQRRTLAASMIDAVGERWDVPAANVYVVYTEHAGVDFHLAEGALQSWEAAESETGAEAEPPDDSDDG